MKAHSAIPPGLAFACRLLLAIAVLGTAAAARADERILDFHSDIAVAADASMIVTETIRVRAEGDRIRHGIFRDFPTDYRDRYGDRVRVGFELLSTERDGQLEDSHSERLGNGMRVYLGSASSDVPYGEHAYSIRYRTTRQLGFFADHDELYWNATGNGWDFPIDHASAAVTLPVEVPPEQIRVLAYTGAQGAKGMNWRGTADKAGRAVFETTRGFGPREGLTIVVEFPKGIVAAPSSKQQLQWLLADNKHILIGLAGLLLVIAYLTIAWWRVGRDPRGGPLIPLYEAPDGWSPAELRYVERMDYDNRCFAADLVDLGVRGLLEIRQAYGGFMLRNRSASPAAVPKVERTLYESLLTGRDELTLEQSEHEIIGGARSAHSAFIVKTRGNDYFRTNGGKLFAGVVFSLLTIYLVDATAGNLPWHNTNGSTIPSLFLLLFSAFPIVFAVIAIAIISGVAARRRKIGGNIFTGLSLYILALIPLGGGTLIGLPAGWFGIGLAAVLIVVLAVAYILLPAPTPAGRQVLDRIAGLRLYLGVAERDALAQQREPEMTEKEFERFLPYALALDVEETWCDRFAAAVGPAAAAAAMTSLAWYSGTSSSSFSTFANDIGSSLSSTISSSSTAPGSSSGSSDSGGSSGGGGGGGGGGGW